MLPKTAFFALFATFWHNLLTYRYYVDIILRIIIARVYTHAAFLGVFMKEKMDAIKNALLK